MTARVSVRFDAFELDEARFELRRRGAPVRVQPKVLDLIFYLVRHRERVVTKEELLAEVWPGVRVADGSLLQAVSTARRLLDDSPEGQRCIRTVRGRGFQFVADATIAAIRPTQGSAREVTSNSLDLDADTVDSGSPSPTPRLPQLVVLLHGDHAALGGAAYSLAGVDEVEIVRGKTRGASRPSEAITQRLVLSLPGDAVSRTHARLVRTRDDWYIVDGGSKNGTLLDGARVARAQLRDGHILECGKTHLLFRESVPSPPELRLDVEGDLGEPGASLIPELCVQRHVLARVARTDLPLLIVGEAGTGKETTARALHERSGRTGPFVPVQAAELGLLDARECGDLFGDRSPATGGTLFLDHLEDLDAAGQTALLAALSRGEAVRLMAASTSAPEERLRRDLYTRLAGYRIDVPPLRERLSDFGLFVGRIAIELGNARAAIAGDAARALFAYAWPGNVRELRQCLASALALSEGGKVGIAHLPPSILRPAE